MASKVCTTHGIHVTFEEVLPGSDYIEADVVNGTDVFRISMTAAVNSSTGGTEIKLNDRRHRLKEGSDTLSDASGMPEKDLDVEFGNVEKELKLASMTRALMNVNDEINALESGPAPASGAAADTAPVPAGATVPRVFKQGRSSRGPYRGKVRAKLYAGS